MAVSVTPIRDTKWLTLEVCREFQRGTCSRPDTECKFAHPSKSCQVANGRVIACFDSLKVSNRYVVSKAVRLRRSGHGGARGSAAARRQRSAAAVALRAAVVLWAQGRTDRHRTSSTGLGSAGVAAARSPLAPDCSVCRWSRGHFVQKQLSHCRDLLFLIAQTRKQYGDWFPPWLQAGWCCPQQRDVHLGAVLSLHVPWVP